jgi:(1->4)-alpha-D-glucan 1-alpha-D-glucosylmutase
VPAFEAAVDAWLERVYADEELAADLARFVGELAPHGDRNALAQLVIKLAAPGVPDFYWGCEQHDDSLVDPDNRRPINFAARRDGARWLTDAQPLGVAQTHDASAIKLWTIRRVLAVRRREPGWWEGAYRPLVASGAHAHRVFAFARGDDLVAVVPRLGVRADGWRETAITLPSGAWRDALSDQTFTGGEQPVAPLWRIFPVALLVRG